MKRLVSSLMTMAMLTGAVAAAGACAEGDGYVYGTMKIPYGAFYEAEGVATEVDAVTSATNAKWKSESLVAGTYSEPHADDEGGDILGVVYPVAIAQADLDALGERDYGFEATDSAPKAYKIVTMEGGEACFSAVQGETTPLEAEATITTDTGWGDYQVDVYAINNAQGTSDIGTILGVLVRTDDGAAYGMRHLENIWRDELAWSTGFVTEENHGNALHSEDYADMMGKSITEITYITETGYHVLATSLYVPVKFEGGAAVADAATKDGVAPLTLSGLPEDYAPRYAVEGLNFEVADGKIAFSDALPGAYTLVVTDGNGRYAELRTDFVLSTDALPVRYDPESRALVPVEGADEALAQAFIANLSTVSVDGTEYAASGRGAVAIINAEGAVDAEAAVVSGRGEEATSTPVFAESGEYGIVATSTGFDQSIEFAVTIEK